VGWKVRRLTPPTTSVVPCTMRGNLLGRGREPSTLSGDHFCDSSIAIALDCKATRRVTSNIEKKTANPEVLGRMLLRMERSL
jgi:hypothetical protein